MKTFILTQKDLKEIVEAVGIDTMMDDLIFRMRRTFQEFDSNRVIIPVRSGFEYHEPDFGLLEWMPAMTVGETVTMKMVGYHPTNTSKRHIPSVFATVSLYDTTSGHLMGLADAIFMTALRTGAASALASELMARPDSKTMGLIGAGVQGLTQLHALSRLFPIETAFVYDIDPVVSQGFVQRASFMPIEIIPITIDSLGDLVRKSDILCTATSVELNSRPVFSDGDTQSWLHINAVGTDTAGKQEIPPALLERCVVSPDFRDQAMIEGECQYLSPEKIGPDLLSLLRDPQRCKKLQKERTIFDSTGWALEDKIAMDLLIEYAQKFQLGTFMQIQSLSEDPLNPYGFFETRPSPATEVPSILEILATRVNG